MGFDKIFDVLAIGELNADLVFTGLKQEPELDREIIAENYKKTLGSSTALCACNIAGLGLNVAFCGKVGDDETGRYVLNELEAKKVNTGFCKIDPDVETGITLALNWNGDKALVSVLGATSSFSLTDFDINIIKPAKHIHIGSFSLLSSLRKDLEKIFKAAHDWNISTSLDTGWNDSEKWDDSIPAVLEHTDIFFPNEIEALHITKAASVETAAAVLEKMCGKTVCIKRGKQGAWCISGGKRYSISAMDDVKVVDTTGAGDAFNAGFIYGHIKGLSAPQCLEYGNACGSIIVGTVGGTSSGLTVDKVQEMIRTHDKAVCLNG